ncbi:radical SAM protein, partial [Clostridium perfringens]|nr:radical SAM protein [Clostridium perfringens]
MSKKHYIIPIFISHQGCPHQCVFCNQDRIAKVIQEEVTDKDVKDTVDDYLKTIDY